MCDRLRPVLPMLLAISANSPFIDGRDAGLHSARTQTFTKSFPRCGVPDPFGDWQAWHEYVDLLVRTELDRRVHPAVVVGAPAPHLRHRRGAHLRRADDRHRGGRAGRADRRLRAGGRCEEIDAGEVPRPVPGRLIEENMWRAIRYGQDGRLLDLEAERVEEYAASEALDRLRAWTGADVVLPELNGAQRQRRLIDTGATPAEVYAVRRKGDPRHIPC